MSLLALDEYLKKAEREYVLEAKSEFQFPIRSKSGEVDYYQRLEQELQCQSDIKALSYRTVKEGWTKVSRPASLGFNEDILLKHRPHLKPLRSCFQKLQQRFSSYPVMDFLRHHYSDCSQDPDALTVALEVFQYLLEHKEDIIGFMPRQIPHGQSTKSIGKNNLLLRFFTYYLKLENATWKDFLKYFKLLDRPAEFRFYAPHCLYQKVLLNHFHGVLAWDWGQFYSFSSLKACLIVENIETFFQLAPQSKDTLLLWGGGWKAAQLKNLFRFLPHPIYYWGDIDKEGYEIYGFLKRIHPQIKSCLMSQEIISKYKALHQKKEIFTGPFRRVEELQSEYEEVCLRGIQIEQEQLNESWPFLPELT